MEVSVAETTLRQDDLAVVFETSTVAGPGWVMCTQVP